MEDIASGADLTKREREIFGFLVRGRSAKHIAETLYISENTAWAHIKRVYAKTGVHSKQELMDLVEGDGDIR
ncbi:response regulator transcription factor [Raoultibacter massiliensis]|uniref:Helix-turn-helix transcriptional regulator n=1 Tax=Raoultibacter massiliensis TaxID=1852371 RepID=A0ABV1JG13_9ACTN